MSNCQLVDTMEQLEGMISSLTKEEIIACDLEASELDVRKASLEGMGLGTSERQYFIPFSNNLPSNGVIGALNAIFKDKTVIFHNAKYDLELLQEKGLPWPKKIQDTLIMSWLVDENSQHGLKQLARAILGREPKKWTELNRNIDLFRGTQEVVKELADYCCDDVKNTYDLYFYFLPILKIEGLLLDYERLELKLIPVLAKMELRGIRINIDDLKKKQKEALILLQEVEVRMKEAVGNDNLNVRSPQQLETTLFDMLKYAPISMTDAGKRSTDNEVLEEIVKQNSLTEEDFVSLLLKFRDLDKLYATYFTALVDQADEDDIIHTNFMQHRTRTGRLSSDAPNLQNIPARSDKWNVREDFIPREGYKFLVADYGQIELRILAHFCLHRSNIVSIFDSSRGIEIGKIVNQKREVMVKAYNFGKNKIEGKRIINYWRNGKIISKSIYRDGNKNWLIINHEGNQSKLILTPNHCVYRADGSKDRISNFKVGDYLLFNQSCLDGISYQIALGSLLGDGNFQKSSKFHSFSFYSSNEDYFNYKKKLLQDFIGSCWKQRSFTKGKGYLGNYVFRAKSIPSFQISKIKQKMDILGVKYPRVKVLKDLDILGLAIWYMDDGNADRDKRCLDINKGWSFHIANVKINTKEVKFLSDKFGINFKKTKRGISVCGEEGMRFNRLICEFIPKCMQYKLAPIYRNKYKKIKNIVKKVTPVKIVNIRRATIKDSYFKDRLVSASFDLEVEGLHNYFAQGILVSNSQDENMVKTFMEDGDIHAMTMKLTGITERRIAKNINFGIIYGMGPRTLARELSIKEDDARRYIEKFFTGYPKVRYYIERIQQNALRDGYVTMITGRKRRFQEIKDKRWFNTIQRQAFNSKIQGSAADLIKIAMVKLDSVLIPFDAHMLVQIHDEIIIETPIDRVAEVKKVVIDTMENALKLRVPIKVKVTEGNSWVKD